MVRFLFLALFATLFLSASDFRVSVNTMNLQDSEGSGATLTYKYSDTLYIDTSYSEVYLRGVKKTSVAGTESWNAFETQRLGVRYYLKSYLEDEIRLYVAAGGEYLFKSSALSDADASFNTYGLFGVDFKIDASFNLEFAMGSSGKGEDATKLVNSPNYAHGFNTIVSVGYNF